MSTLNKRAFQIMVAEDVAWLDNQNHSHELMHIRDILKDCVKHYYPDGDSITLTADEARRIRKFRFEAGLFFFLNGCSKDNAAVIAWKAIADIKLGDGG